MAAPERSDVGDDVLQFTDGTHTKQKDTELKAAYQSEADVVNDRTVCNGVSVNGHHSENDSMDRSSSVITQESLAGQSASSSDVVRQTSSSTFSEAELIGRRTEDDSQISDASSSCASVDVRFLEKGADKARSAVITQDTAAVQPESVRTMARHETELAFSKADIVNSGRTMREQAQDLFALAESGMIDLSSANNSFMQTRLTSNQPLYANRELPKFLQDSLEESLSRLTITVGEEQQFYEEKSIDFIDYSSEKQLPDLTALITKDLSEPYSVYTYRYFLHNWPHLSFLAYCNSLCVGAIVCKLDQHRKDVWRGYIAMLAVHKDYRRFKIGTKLVQKAIRRMIEQGCDEIVLETEVTNTAALNLYENLGFVRDKRLLRYYLNGVDAWRLKLWLV